MSEQLKGFEGLDTLRVEVTDQIATVTLLTTTMAPAFFAEVGRVFRALAAFDSLRCVVVEAEGKAFSYGLDLQAAFGSLGPHLQGGLAGSRSELRSLIRRWQDDFDAVARCPVPVIAAIHGWCIGGGLDLASACDIRLASDDARISLRETRIAIVADLGSLQRLPGIIGRGLTAELAYTGGDVDAGRAESIGLVNAVLPGREELREAAHAMARAIAANPPLTVRGVKDVLRFGEGKTPAEGLEYVATWNSAFLASEDLVEAMQAFMQKRQPDYRGR